MTGIDRVEYALARWLSDHQDVIDGGCAFLVQTRHARGLIDPARMAMTLQAMALARGLLSGPTAMMDRVAHELWQSATPGIIGATRLAGLPPSNVGRRFMRLATEAIALQGGRAFKRLLSERSARLRYLHVSHYGLQWPKRFEWVARHDVKATFFIHDVIPIDFPQYCSAGAHVSHMRKLETVARLARRVAVNSCYSAERLMAALEVQELRVPTIAVHRLGVGALSGGEFRPNSLSSNADLTLVPYFLYVGTIEGRKNVALLLDVWRRLAAEFPAEHVPRLVLAGTRGWSNDAVLRDLDEMTDIGRYIIEVNGLNDAELALLISGARALLMPSHAEGYSMAVAEAQALGSPVIVSDIPAHVELDPAGMLVPRTVEDWKNAIISYPGLVSPPAPQPRWDDFAQKLVAFASAG